MRLPNGERAVVELRKLTEYCLSPQHPRGRNKARVFASAGVYLEDAAELQAKLLRAAREGDAAISEPSSYGDRYVIDFVWEWQGRSVNVKSSWILDLGTEVPRLTSCYVL